MCTGELDGITPSASLEIAKYVEHTFTIRGTARGVPQMTNHVWTIEGDSSSRRGIPSEIQSLVVQGVFSLVGFERTHRLRDDRR